MMRNILVGVLLTATAALAENNPAVSLSPATLPVHFEPAAPGSDHAFVARPAGHFAALSADSARFAFKSKTACEPWKKGEFRAAADKSQTHHVVEMRFAGASPEAAAAGQQLLPGYSNYLTGSDESAWRTRVPHYGSVVFTGVYPGIDVRYRGVERQLEFDFIVAPDANPGVVEIQFAGSATRLTPAGDLLLGSPDLHVALAKPVAYQEVGATRKEVPATFAELRTGVFGFTLGEYDHSRPLVIDPILRYSSFLGGTGDDEAHAMALDATGNIFVTGSTTGAFPVKSGGYDTTFNGNVDAFVTKINPDVSGSAGIVFSTYLGGSQFDQGNGIAVDSSGVYVGGDTASTNFPRTGLSGSGGGYDGFVTKLNVTGTGIVYSRRIGGTGEDLVSGLAANSAGETFICGRTASTGFPVTKYGFQRTKAAAYEGYVTKIAANGGSLVYSTFLGGNGNDECLAIVVDSGGRAYVTGDTSSSTFPTTSDRFDPYNSGGVDAFVTKFNFNGSSLVYSTYLGGLGTDVAATIAVDSSQAITVAGYTSSLDFPLLRTLHNYGGGGLDAFVTKFLPDNSALAFSTYLGGGADDDALALATDREGDLYLAGETNSSDFPLSNEFDSDYAGSGDVFVSKLNSAGSHLVYSTFMGGSGEDGAFALVVGSLHETFVSGFTKSTAGWPVTANAAQATPGGASDAFVARLMPTWGAMAIESFPTPASPNGWVQAGLVDPSLVGYEYDSVNQALRVRVYSSGVDGSGNATHCRVPVYVNTDPVQLPYSAVGPDNYVRTKYWIYAAEQANPSQKNQIPNFRLRAAVGFSQTAFLEVNHHLLADSGNARYAEELCPSTDPAKPSMYRVDLDPVDVPWLVQNGASVGIMQGFEAMSLEPQENGVIALAETSIGTYPASRLPNTGNLVKVYAPTESDAGDLRVFESYELDRYNLYFPPGTPPGVFPTRENTNLSTYGQGTFGITMDSSNVPSDRIGVCSRDFNPDRGTNLYSLRPRVREGRQWKIRYHMTSTQTTNRQAFITIRGRSIHWAWNQSLDLGGPIAPPVPFSQQMLPGIGSQNPDKDASENGGWYTFIMHSPLSNDIRPEFAAEVPISERMPDIAAQPGPGQSYPSRRDLMFGADLIDTLDIGPGSELEQGNVTIDRVEVSEYELVDD